MWVLDGIVMQNLEQSSLQKVSDELAKTGLVPSGYFYPGLHCQKGLPEELKSVLKRKIAH